MNARTRQLLPTTNGDTAAWPCLPRVYCCGRHRPSEPGPSSAPVVRTGSGRGRRVNAGSGAATMERMRTARRLTRTGRERRRAAEGSCPGARSRMSGCRSQCRSHQRRCEGETRSASVARQTLRRIAIARRYASRYFGAEPRTQSKSTAMARSSSPSQTGPPPSWIRIAASQARIRPSTVGWSNTNPVPWP